MAGAAGLDPRVSLITLRTETEARTSWKQTTSLAASVVKHKAAYSASREVVD